MVIVAAGLRGGFHAAAVLMWPLPTACTRVTAMLGSWPLLLPPPQRRDQALVHARAAARAP